MSDDRWQDDANSEGDRPYLDEAPKPKRSWFQDAKGQHVSGEEILEWVKKTFRSGNC